MIISMSIFSSFLIVLLVFVQLISCQSFRPAIRVRLNRPVFDQASSIVQGLVEYEVPRVNIPSTRQCFQEGCVDAHSFRMSSFRQPSFVAFEPHFPNKFRIRVTDFDFVVTGQLSGTITVILNIPITGNVVVTGRSIGVSALLDLQKTVNDQPYLRFNECKIENGIVSTRVANMGLLTDTINQKFGTVLSGQSRIQLEEAICEHMNRLTQQHFSTRLARIPRSLSAKELLEIIISNNVKKNPTSPATNFATLVRQKRATTTSDDYYDDIEKTEGRPAKPLPNVNLRKISLSRDDVINFFNIERLSHILIDLTLLDAASTSSDFSLGISGNVYSSRSQGTTPYSAPYPFKIPQNNNRRMVEVIVSQYSLNSLLFQAHRTNSLIFHVNSKTPGIGSLLKTSCTIDEVCISDEIPKIKSVYPNRRLELIIRSAAPPTVTINNGKCNDRFYEWQMYIFLGGNSSKNRSCSIQYSSSNQHENHCWETDRFRRTVTIQSLDFVSGVDFLGMSVSDLDGLRRTTKAALQNFVSSTTADGFTLSTASMHSPLRLFHPEVSLLPNALLLQADVDLYRTLYSARKTRKSV
ncbi:hypothetical protein CAEBREN_29907 [Caenorhabditis brenneri]|uniref:Lipid-binding serum glycoprotein C-terminal domain-containing protein n=1 Tax=Caenorhabditis brenneri TaxID=135651 RepID=G0NTV4_CAEBE|nr:hypothetical protein CAEBREN_29907 [Caenorhabditis brenneri]